MSSHKLKPALPHDSWQRLDEFEPVWPDANYPKVSIIIPTLNSAPLIASTLEALLAQDYPLFEVIVIDAGSVDRTPQIIAGLQDPRVKIYSISGYSRYEMLNKGITHATGEYLNFLFPGDFYISQYTLKSMMWLARQNSYPSLVYCGTLLRDGRSEVKALYRPLTLALVQSGSQPTSLQSCWFHKDLFRKIGKFNTQLELRGGLDLLCRFMLDKHPRFASIEHVYTDYDLRQVTRQMVIRHFYETFRIVARYFGPAALFRWLFKQDDIKRYLKLWSRSFRFALLGKQ